MRVAGLPRNVPARWERKGREKRRLFREPMEPEPVYTRWIKGIVDSRVIRIMNIWQKTLAATALTAAFAVPAFADDSTALLVASRGEVFAENEADRRALARGDSVEEEERIITGDKSFAVLQFIDGAKVTVRPNSVLDIKEYVYNGGDENAATLSLVQGGLRVITGAMAKAEPESFKVETPVALMGVRGTEFAIVLCDDGSICQEEGADY